MQTFASIEIALKQMSYFRVTGAVVAHRTLNPLVLGSNPRSPIIETKKRDMRRISLLIKQGRAIAMRSLFLVWN